LTRVLIGWRSGESIAIRIDERVAAVQRRPQLAHGGGCWRVSAPSEMTRIAARCRVRVSISGSASRIAS